MTKRSSLAAIGEPFVRKEDAELVTGQGRFSDDVEAPWQGTVDLPHARPWLAGERAACGPMAEEEPDYSSHESKLSCGGVWLKDPSCGRRYSSVCS